MGYKPTDRGYNWPVTTQFITARLVAMEDAVESCFANNVNPE